MEAYNAMLDQCSLGQCHRQLFVFDTVGLLRFHTPQVVRRFLEASPWSSTWQVDRPASKR